MTVFKYYYKIVKKFIPSIIMFTAIAFGIAFFASGSMKETVDFTSSKPNVAIINRDDETNLVKHFNNYVNDNSNLVEIADEDNAIKDTLFFREASLILIIPAGFTNNLMSGKSPIIDILKTPDATSIYSEMLINRYLKLANVYAMAGMNENDIVKNIDNDLQKTANIINTSDHSTSIENISYLFNFLNYTILSLAILIVAMIMSSFKKEMIKKRNMISPIPERRINSVLFLGNLSIIFILWMLFIALSCIIYPQAMFTEYGLLLSINSLLFSFTGLSIGFLIGNLVTNQEAISALANVIGLGTSFISGAFVPQSMLGSLVLNISKVFPSYWYITNNDLIVKLSYFNFETLKSILKNYIIIIGFGIAIFIVTILINRFLIKRK